MSLMKRQKPLIYGLLGIALLAAPAHAAGTTPLALVPQVDSAGNPASGCQLNFFVAGTVATKQNAYADFGLTQALPNPLSCDQAGRVPMHWLADGLIHIRLTTSAGVPIVDTTMQVLGPSSGGGGGGGTVDPTTVMATGDLKARYGTGLLSGFVRANGLTIGNAVSGATERANADTQGLFIYLYSVDPNLVVSGGRTGNALNDYNAGKTITTPDWRGRALAFLDDMGNAPAGQLTSAYFGATATTLGASGGGESLTLALSQLPTGITSTGTATGISGGGLRIPLASSTEFDLSFSPSGSGTHVPAATGWTFSNSLSGAASVTSNNTSGSPHRTVQPTRLATIYLKL